MQENTFPSWYPVQIRFRDLDPLAHVNNTVYFTYLRKREATTSIIWKPGSMSGLREKSIKRWKASSPILPTIPASKRALMAGTMAY